MLRLYIDMPDRCDILQEDTRVLREVRGSAFIPAIMDPSGARSDISKEAKGHSPKLRDVH
jgi:hypothetical protein